MTNPVAAWASDSIVRIEELHNAVELLALEMGQASHAVCQLHADAMSAGSDEVLAVIHAVSAADHRLAAAVHEARALRPPPNAASAAWLARALEHLEEFVNSDLGDGIVLSAWHAAMTELAEFTESIAAALDMP